MNSIRSFQEENYEKHSKFFEKYRSDGEKEVQAKTWFEHEKLLDNGPLQKKVKRQINNLDL